MIKHRVLDRPKMAALIMGWTIDGKSCYEVVALLKEHHVEVSPQAVNGFLRRHRPEIDALASRVMAAVEHHLISVKDSRIAAKQERWDGLKQVVEERGKDPAWQDVPGWKTGLLVHTFKSSGGKDAYMVDEFAVDTGLLNGFDRLERETAEELGQLPKADVNIDNRIQVLVRQVRGFDPDALA